MSNVANSLVSSFGRRLRSIIADLNELIFPPPELCMICRRQLPPPILPIPSPMTHLQSVLCNACMSRLTWAQPPLCARCGRPWRQAGLCRMCATGVCQMQGSSALVYTGIVRDLVHQLKFRSVYELGEPLGYIAGGAAFRLMGQWQPDAIAPVPLHHDRLLERGFNQAELLAVGVGKLLGCPIKPHVLERVKAAVPQSSLSLTDRLRNVQSAFTVPVPASVAGLRILLVDDVYTTGATLHVAGMTLLRAGALSVRFVTLASAVSDLDVAGI